MTNNFNDPFAANLVGLWDFLDSGPKKDTGLADGIAQNGSIRGNVNFSGGKAHFDGHGDVFDVAGDDKVHGNDAPFDLSEGTVAVVFKQDCHVGTSPDTIVTRGEYADRTHEGFFEIRVTKDGRVQVQHTDGGQDLQLSTHAHFFNEGDTLKVTYSWSETEGGTFQVENLSTNATEVIDFATTGLTMDIGDNDDEAFSFGAREADDGHYDRFFDGSIDYVAIYDRDIINNPPVDPDGVVEGSNAGELIDAGYEGDPDGDKIDNADAVLPGEAPNDDIVDAGGGDDTIRSGEGDDDVYAGTGSDSVQGGAGDDLIFGDSNAPAGTGATVRESFEWDEAGVANGQDLSGFVQNTGNVDVTFSILKETGAADTEFESTNQNISGIVDDGTTPDDNSSLYSVANGHGNQADYQLSFSAPVADVSFRINDIDGDGVVRVLAFDAAGNPIEVNLDGGALLTLSDTDGVAGNDTADSNGGYLEDDAPEYSVLVSIPGPVSRIVIEHDQNGPNNSGINVTDVYFDAPVLDAGVDGNDTLEGDAGDDTIFGEGGDDLISGGIGRDSLNGGAGDDSIDGGAGDDNVQGGVGDDVIFGDGGLDQGVNLIQNGSFENTTGLTETGYGFVGNGAVPGWTETNGADIDIHNDGRGGVDASDGSNWLDLSATPSEGVIGQNVAGVVEGETYLLSFDVADGNSLPGGENLVDVFWGGELVARIDPASNEMDDFNFVLVGGAGDGSNRLEFANVGGDDNFGASIDNVRLIAGNTPGTAIGDDTLAGGDDDDIIFGQGGEDSIDGGAGEDTIDGGDDDDVITGGRGSDSIFGGDGADEITAGDPADDFLVDKGYPGLFPGEEGTPATENDLDFVDGGAGNDTISTGDDRDTIVGGSGDDQIDGGIDDDEISGDEGADRIVGGEGSDLIEGGTGNDTIYAGNDPDLGLDILNIEDDGTNANGFGPDLRPDNGRDTVFGGEGDDVIFGADDDDQLFGEEGDDTIDGEIDDDLIDGGTGNDSLRGGQGDDTVMGGDGRDTIDGGIGNDLLSGGADEDLFINVNAGDTVDGGGDATTGQDFDVLDLRGSTPTGGSFTIDITGPDANGNGFDGVVNYFDDNGDDAGSIIFTDIEDIIPCFTPGTMIATASGERLVQDLNVGDRVITRDNGIQEIRWIGARDMSGDELSRAPHLRPVLIRKGALGKGLPERDMLVSPQHRVLMASDKTALYFDEAEVLVAAKHLTDMDGIDVVEVSHTTYIHVMFDQHEVILSDGAWTESFQPGDQTLASMGDAQRSEILELFPELGTVVGIEAYAAARRSLKKHEAKLLSQ